MTEFDLYNRALRLVGDFRITLAASKTVSAATAANPVVCTSAAHGFANDDLVLLERFVQMTQVNGRIFQVANVTTNTFELRDEDGSTYTAETTGGRASKVLPASSKHVLVTFDAWKITRDEVFRDHPWNSCVKTTRLARLQAAKTVTGATAANPVVITAVAHGYTSGNMVLLENLGGMVEVNDRYFPVIVLTANTFSIGVDGTLFTAYTSGGTAKKVGIPLQNDFGFDLSVRYTLPTDALRVLELVDSDAFWEVRGSILVTDEGPTVPIRYVRREIDPAKWDAILVSALSTRLAYDITESVSGNSTKKEALGRDYDAILGKAKMADAQEASPSEFALDRWLSVRF